MTPQDRCRRRVAGALAGSALVGTLLTGVGAPIASAAPGDDTTDTEAPAQPQMTGEQALAIIQQEYDLGAGGGQLSNFVHEVLVLRNLGFLTSVFGEGFDPNEYRLLLFGMGMVAMMVWRPRGLISERQPSVFLKERKAISSAHVKEGHG